MHHIKDYFTETSRQKVQAERKAFLEEARKAHQEKLFGPMDANTEAEKSSEEVINEGAEECADDKPTIDIPNWEIK